MSGAGGERVRAGVRIVLAATIVSGIVQATTMVVLARLLEPVDYGLFVVCLSVNGLSVAFLMSVIERAMVIEADEAALAGRALPLVAGLLVLAAATVAACAAVRARTGWAIDLRVLALVLGTQAASGIATVPRARLRCRMRFGRIMMGEVAGLVLGNLLTGAALAAAGFGMFALAGGFVMSTAVAGLFVVSGAGGSYADVGFRIGGVRPLVRTAGGAIRPASMEALNGQLSPLVVSSVLGAAPLGLFNRVATVVTLPVQLLMASFNRVLISALVTVADDPDRHRRAARLMIRMATALVTPLTFGLAGSADAFVATVLGPKWTAAAYIVPLLAVAVWGTMIGTLFGQIAESVRRFGAKTRVQATATAILVAGLLAGGRWGMTGIAAGAAIGGLALAGLYVPLVAAIVRRPVRTILVWLLPGVAAGVATFCAARVAGIAMSGHAPPVVLATQVAACAAAALLSYLACDRALLHDVARLLLPQRIAGAVVRLLPAAVR